jgi:hypothetical protein
MIQTRWVRYFGMSRLSRRQQLRSKAWIVVFVSMLLLKFAPGLSGVSLGLSLGALGWLVLSGWGRVRVGLDKIEARSIFRGFTLSQADILAFRYVGELPSPREWYIETEQELLPLGAGKAATRLVESMLEQWPYMPRPSSAMIGALGVADYRTQSRDPRELLVILRIPGLPTQDRVRIAALVKRCGPEYAREVDALAEATLDPAERDQLRGA